MLRTLQLDPRGAEVTPSLAKAIGPSATGHGKEEQHKEVSRKKSKAALAMGLGLYAACLHLPGTQGRSQLDALGTR